MENRIKKHQIGAEALFWLCFLIYTALTFYLFYQQTANYEDGRFLSDMPSYMNGVLGINERDPYPYRLFFWVVGALNTVFPIRLSAAFGTVLFNSLTVLILLHYLSKNLAPFSGTYLIKTKRDKEIDLYPYLPVLLVFACLMASMIILPIDALYKFPGQYYTGQGSGNLWHNATYLATRPFATLAFFQFSELLETYEEKVDPKKLLFFAGSMFLTVFAKPTFAVVMMPASALILIYRLFSKKFKNFKNTVFFALAFLPAALDMLRQYLPVFGKDEESGIGFGFGDVWKQYTYSILFSIVLCFAFAIYIRSCNWKPSEHKTLFNFSSIFLLVSLFEGVFLYEKGLRMPDGNFLQGYLHAMFYLFIVSAIVWLGRNKEPKRKLAYDIGAAIFFFAHVASGIFYFIRLVLGNKFY